MKIRTVLIVGAIVIAAIWYFGGYYTRTNQATQ